MASLKLNQVVKWLNVLSYHPLCEHFVYYLSLLKYTYNTSTIIQRQYNNEITLLLFHQLSTYEQLKKPTRPGFQEKMSIYMLKYLLLKRTVFLDTLYFCTKSKVSQCCYQSLKCINWYYMQKYKYFAEGKCICLNQILSCQALSLSLLFFSKRER